MNATFEGDGKEQHKLGGNLDRVAVREAVDGETCLFQLLYQAAMNEEMTVMAMQKALACEDYETARKLAGRLTAQYDYNSLKPTPQTSRQPGSGFDA